jgi:eukaryotic-like serine/threonine-protein kinase
VRQGEQYRPQDYQTGEVRFVLRPIAGQTAVFALEEHIRPIPPPDKTFAPSSRGTCQEVWTDAGGKPLSATWDGTQLSVELAKIEPKSGNFIAKKDLIVSCVALRKLSTARVGGVLTRLPPAAPSP